MHGPKGSMKSCGIHFVRSQGLCQLTSSWDKDTLFWETMNIIGRMVREQAFIFLVQNYSVKYVYCVVRTHSPKRDNYSNRASEFLEGISGVHESFQRCFEKQVISYSGSWLREVKKGVVNTVIARTPG